jgi:hypothetical protein
MMAPSFMLKEGDRATLASTPLQGVYCPERLSLGAHSGAAIGGRQRANAVGPTNSVRVLLGVPVATRQVVEPSA